MNATVPAPLRDAIPAIVTHETSLETVQPHCVPDALTLMLPEPPSLGKTS